MSNFPPKTKEEARAWLRAVMGPPHRTLEGQEYDDISLLLKLAKPHQTSNNQVTMSEEYRLGGKTYVVTYFPRCVNPEIDEVEDDIQQD